ncbi:MAG: DUF4160 domain-containing protein [Phycisphaerae bacterium]|nr:DUF4160 domain-containing protein [Phycisphaerae bacterium]
MPRIWYEQGFHFSFFAADGGEPAHVHVRKGNGAGKWWIGDASEAKSRGFTRAERSRIARIVREQRERFQEAWDREFGSGG